MAFHVACPITCRKVCFCALGFAGLLRSEEGKKDFLEEVARVEQFLSDPWLIKGTENETIQVKVPKVVGMHQLPAAVVGGGGDVKTDSPLLKRVVLHKKAAAASMVAEDFVNSEKDATAEESNGKVMCRLCFSGENEGSEKARKMISCGSCGKKYHRSCLKVWSQNRDLFHWSSWACPSCRTCEVCHRTGDPNKFMFCKRCDGAYHCYCQQPPHKNPGHGPYLCPKHTKCHSCGSSVPGNGLSVRWFLGYTCCDACGRLFVKGNYCPACLKVYRDSESTPMVCCDICQRWVHCPCDGISEAKYQQYQVDGNLQYVCPTCRGECCQIRSPEEAVQELWRRRDESDKDLIASLRTAAGLPTQIFDVSPFSDDEEKGGHASLKFSLKGSPRKNNSKKSKGKEEEMQNSTSSPGDEVAKKSRTIKIKSSRVEGSTTGLRTAQGPKLVIHLGGRSRNATPPPPPRSSNGGNLIKLKTAAYSVLTEGGTEESASARKPFLRFKIPKNSSNGNADTESHDTSPLPGKDDITYTRGQRSKRRRPGDEEDTAIKDFTDANWILQKLGKDAAGKRVEVHQPSSNSWRRGTVIEVEAGTTVSIDLDDGKVKSFELGKQGIRFVSQKQKV